jgi:protein-arginine kinase activator protein McsA
MLCAKCNQKKAMIHFTTVVDGAEEETVHLCKDCAPLTGIDLDKLDLEDMEALSVVGKKCEFCGRDAFSGEMRRTGGATYWCFDCGAELMRIVTELLMAEHVEFLRQSKEDSSFLAFCSDPEFQTWSEAANQKAVRILKDRRKQEGRDESS